MSSPKVTRAGTGNKNFFIWPNLALALISDSPTPGDADEK